MHTQSRGDGPCRHFDRLVQINLRGCVVKVPENNTVLRGIQFLCMDGVTAGNYCWNGDCSNCRIWFEGNDGRICSGLACRMPVRSGMVITALSPDLENALADPPPRA